MHCPEKDSPLLTVGMPVYNGEQFIAQALQSLVDQTFRDWIMVVGDNCSTDDTAAIVEEFSLRDSRIRLVRHEENLGAFGNFQFLVTQAKTPYFMWAAVDDEWAPDFMATLVQHCGTVGLVMTDYETVFHHTGNVQAAYMPRFDPKASLYENAKGFLKNMQPSLVYGVYQTKVLQECVPQAPFDFWDCSLIFSVLMRYGVTTVPGLRYRAGVYGEVYEVKLAAPEKGRLSYGSFARTMLTEVWRTRQLAAADKVRLSFHIARTLLNLRRHLDPIVQQQQKSSN